MSALTTHLPSTYRICNPSFKYESSRNPRRVLTKPSKGTKNDGYDNEDSDYILYVNDILGNEESGHKYALPSIERKGPCLISGVVGIDTSSWTCSVKERSARWSNARTLRLRR